MKNINFLKFNYIFISLSIISLIFISIFLFINNINYGIDFKGGNYIQLKYNNNINIENIKKELNNNSNFQNIKIIKYDNNEIKIIFQNFKENLNNDISDILLSTLSNKNFEIRKIDLIGSKVSKNLKLNALKAIGLSFIIILLYLTFQFEWKFSVAAIITLIHDIIIVFGITQLFNIPLNLEIVGALLTIIGYSLNDTIVVFGKIRENIMNTRNNLKDNINYALNKTIKRTLLTSFTTLLVVFTLLIFGGDSTFNFSFTLFLGIIFGTYSSLYISTYILFLLKFDIIKYKEKINNKIKKTEEKERIARESDFGRIDFNN